MLQCCVAPYQQLLATRIAHGCWNDYCSRLTNQQGVNNGTAQINLISFQFYIVNNSEHYCFNNVDMTTLSGDFFRGKKNI